MGNTDKNKSKKYRRKIRIRLKDPNIPDSYVCEIFDSSLENEEEEPKNNGLEEKEDPSKPKNYFELLMSRECRKSNVINSVKENHVLKVVDGEELSRTTKRKNQKNRKLSQSVHGKKEERKSESDSSDDETLLQIQRKDKNLEEGDENEVIYIEEESAAKEDFELNDDVIIELESSKVELSNKKNFGILNYFSKKESNLKRRVNCDKLEEITLQNSLKTSHTSKSLKGVKKQDSEKAEHKILNGINKENVKLAPLFYKKATKVIDSARQKARLEFLFKESSGIKKSENKNQESILTFPKVSHVQQRNENMCWSQREICLPLPEVQVSGEYVLSTDKIFNFKIENVDIMNYSVNNIQSTTEKDLFIKKKCKYLELNMDLVIDGLKEKQEKFLSQAEEVEKSNHVRSMGVETGFEELNTLWTDKYKPRSSEILGNDDVVRKVKKWLQSWKSFDEELKVLVKSNRSSKNNKESDDDDSDDDFMDPNGQNYGLKAPCNVCIISGPNGCGKTALVYALAGELEFSVLELNASSKRTGKKVLTNLQEATQSHKVQRVNLLQTELLQKEMKKKRNHKKKKNKKLEKPGKVPEQPNDCKISLILIEDAEIVYEEHDEGFFGAITSLVQTSKRPLIFLTNDPNCHYLYNFKTEQCLILEMEPPNLYSSCAVLDVVSALEGGNFEREFLDSFVRENNFDLRRSLLQLQFWMHSENSENGNEKSSEEKVFDLGRLWWGLSTFLFKQDIRHFVKTTTRKRKRVNDLFDSSDEELESATKKHKPNSSDSINPSALSACEINKKSNVCIESYFRVLDLVSTLDSFRLPGGQEPIPGSQCRPKDSLSLEENMEEAPWIGQNMAEEISRELISLSTRVFAEELKEKTTEDRKLNFVSPCWEEIRWRKTQEKASEELSLVVPLQRGRDTRSLHLDYLPLLRNMCRTERNRSEMNPKRKNRFYHYLNNFGLELTEEKLEINCDVLERR